MPQRILITGGNGFVGRHLIPELLTYTAASDILVWDRTRMADVPVAQEEVDITLPATYVASLKTFAPTWIIHLAAQASVPASLREPAATHRLNVTATQELMAAAQELSAKSKFLVISTADVYGTRSAATPLPELSLADARPQNPYAQSKWEMEQIIEKHYRSMTIRVRPFPHLGPGQQRGFVAADFASQIAALESSVTQATDFDDELSRIADPAVIKVGNLEAQRDFTDVRDVVRAYRLLLQKGVCGEVYHVASGRAVLIKTLLDMLLAHARVPITVVLDPTRLRPSDTPIVVGDASKLRAATGWQPHIPLAQTVSDIMDWWRAHPATG